MMVDVREQEPGGKAFKTIFDLLTSNLHTSLPGIIIDFDNTARTCSVQPALKRLYTGDEEATLLPVQEDVPVQYPGSNDFYLEFELKKGDEVLCIVAERALDQWLDSGGTTDPQSRRRFSLSDIVVVPGLKSNANTQGPVGEGIALRNAKGTVEARVVSDKITAKVLTTTMEVDVLGVKVKPDLTLPTDVQAYQPIPVPLVLPPGGTAAAGYVSLVNHVHQDGTGLPTTLPIPIPGPP
jgi:hypothetical protein